MKVLETILPVLAVLLLGMLSRKIQLLSRSGVDNIKKFVTRVLLPVAIFHALGTAEYSGLTWISVLIMLVMMAVSFGIGYLLRPLVPAPYGKYVPFMVSVYEGGMIAYPLFISLCGMENLSQIAIVDIAGLLFGFSIYMGLLNQVENNTKVSVRLLVWDALKNPAFLATVFGLIAGLTGLLPMLLESSAGNTYLAVKNMITAPLNTLILVVVGYDIVLDEKLIKPCMRTILLRVILQTVMILGVLAAMHCFVGKSMLLDFAVICYMSAPATFSMQSYLKDKEASAYASTTNSLYCLVSITVYIVLAVLK